MNKFKIGDRVEGEGVSGVIVIADLYGLYVLIKRSDGEGWTCLAGRLGIPETRTDLIGVDGLWWVKESSLHLCSGQADYEIDE